MQGGRSKELQKGILIAVFGDQVRGRFDADHLHVTILFFGERAQLKIAVDVGGESIFAKEAIYVFRRDFRAHLENAIRAHVPDAQ